MEFLTLSNIKYSQNSYLRPTLVLIWAVQVLLSWNLTQTILVIWLPHKYFMLILGVYTRVEKYANWIQENAEYTYIEPTSSGTKMTSSILSFTLLVILLKYLFY